MKHQQRQRTVLLRLLIFLFVAAALLAGPAPQLWDTAAQSAIAAYISETPWAYPALKTLHIMSIGLLYGCLFAYGLRALNFGRAIPLEALGDHVFPWVWLGLAINVVSGTLMFLPNAQDYADNPAFQLKVLLVLALGVNLEVNQRIVRFYANDGKPTLRARIVAIGSLAFWTCVIAAGSMVAYTAA
ncbi:MAG: DUF6644 family protein [Pseudomonadota bacterium]